MTKKLYERVPPEYPYSGSAELSFIGEAPSDEEQLEGRPLVGSAGRLHNKILKSAGISRWDCHTDNVFSFKLPKNEVKNITITRAQQQQALRYASKEWLNEFDQLSYDIATTYIERGHYLPLEYWHELLRLRESILDSGANTVVALGGTALWALTGTHGIGSARGAPMECVLVPGVKVVPSYHPSYVLQNYRARIIARQDYKRAWKERHDPHIEVASRKIWLEPDWNDLKEFGQEHIEPLVGTEVPLSVDIETSKGQIECIGFAPSPHIAIVVPFVDFSAKTQSYWPTEHQEHLAWDWCRYWLEHPELKILGQNFVYDAQWLWEKFGIRSINYSEDTRLMHHAIYPELPKGLDFLVSVYAKERAWKYLGKASGKRDE